MKMFGEFLVEQGIVQRRDLLTALVQQLQRLPSYAEVVFDLKLLPDEMLLEAFRLQTVRKVSFVEACQELKIWTPALNDAIHEEVRKRRVPLGELLLEMNLIDADQLTRALDDYLGGVKEAASAAAAAPAPSPAAAAPGTGTAACLTVLAGFAKARLKELSEADLTAAAEELHTIRGHARLNNAEPLEKLVSELEPLFARLKEKRGAEMPDEQFEKAQRLLPAAVGLVAELAAAAENGGAAVSTPEKQKAFDQCLNELPVLNFDMDFL